MAGTLTVQNIQGPTSGDNANKIIVPSGHTLESVGAVVAPHSIVQTIQDNSIANLTNSSTSTWADTNYQISITPIYSDSKIELIYMVPFRLSGSGDKMRGGHRIYRDISGGSSTLIINTSSNLELFQVRNAANEYDNIHSGVFIDSPATTSQVTYRIQNYIHGDTGASFIQSKASDVGGSLIVREIAQ